MTDFLLFLTWDPDPAMFPFPLPLLNRPILWYGFFFALGFAVGYAVLLRILRREFTSWTKQRISKFAEQLSFYVIIGTLIGARLGDILFYQDFRSLWNHPLSLIAIWEGGLASHGGAVGILCALFLFSKNVKIGFWKVIDWVVIPASIAAVFIRIGNFFNQEILGTPTQLPWGVLFLHPIDGGAVVPRHPAQLYEACAYLITFLILMFVYPYFKRTGKLTGLFFVLVFSFRFLIEFLKVEQSIWIQTSWGLSMGQWLSLPFIVLGVILLRREL